MQVCKGAKGATPDQLWVKYFTEVGPLVWQMEDQHYIHIDDVLQVLQVLNVEKRGRKIVYVFLEFSC